MSRIAQLLLPVLLIGCFGACEAPKPNRFTVDPVLYPAEEEVREVLVWPVLTVGAEGTLEPELLGLLRTRLYEGMIRQRFSALSPTKVDGWVREFGATEAGASKAVNAAAAGGVLILTLSQWDEGGLYSLGKIRAGGEIKILDQGSRLRWKGTVTVDAKLVPDGAGNASLEDKRRMAVEEFARRLARWLPAKL